MPPHIAIYDLAGDPAEPVAISIQGGEESTVQSVEIWNDKDDAFLDTTTAQNARVKLLASSSGGPFVSSGDPVLDERWTRFRITHFLTAAGASTSGATGTLPIGTNSEIPLPDLAPQEGVRVEFYVTAPGGVSVDATLLELAIDGNQASSPLSQRVTLAHGSGVLPGDRIHGLRSLLRGSVVTADDSDTVVISRGLMVYDGANIVTLESGETFTLADSEAVDLDAGESYRVTLSRQADGTITATKGPKEEPTLWPEVPAGEIFVAYLTVESADGIAVTVSQASVLQSATLYHEFLVRAGDGLTVLVARGDGITSTDFRQYLSHEIPLEVADDDASYIWRLADGTMLDTLTDVEPEVGADLLAVVTAAAGAITEVVDARKFTHRAIVEWRETLTYRGVLSDLAEPSDGLDWIVLPEGEIERVELDLSDVDASWTAGAILVDVLTVAPGEAATGGVTIFTGSGTDDARPSIAFDATVLRSVSVDHEVRRVIAGTRALLSVVTTVAAPAPEPEQEIRVTLVMRRYR